MGTFRDLRDGRALVTWDLPGEELPFTLGKYRAMSVQVSGDFFGERVDLLGSNELADDCVFALLNDPNGNSLSFGTPKIEQILEDCVKIVPKYTGNPGPDVKIRVSVLLYQVR